MEIFSSRIQEPYFGFTRPLYLYLVFMFTTSSKNCSNNKLIEQTHRYYCYIYIYIFIRTYSTKKHVQYINQSVHSVYNRYIKSL